MCRLYAYQGKKPALPVLMEGLRRLEYGGYDSAGVTIYHNGRLNTRKTVGEVKDLADLIEREPLDGTSGIAHTRWATNGPPSTPNAHPHVSWNGKIALAHNGVQDSANEERERARLKSHGISCVSDTDSEVIANVIALELEGGANSLEDAVERGLRHIEGAYALVIMGEDYPDRVVGVRQSSPLTLGVNGESVFLASDPIAFAGFATHKIELLDNEMVTLVGGKYYFRKNLNADRLEKYDVCAEQVSKGGYPSFLLKEISEQGDALRSVLAGRLRDDGLIRLGGIEKFEKRIAAARRIVLTGCGTAYNAAMVGKSLIEDFAGIPVEVQYAHEFRTAVLTPNDVVIAISQSGETMDTIMAVRAAKETGALCLGINNRVGSTLAGIVDAGIYLRAGPEISVASTKAFLAMLVVLTLLALRLGQVREWREPQRRMQVAKALSHIPDLVKEALKTHDQVKKIAQEICHAKTVLFLGRGYGNLADEGALKLQEVAYLNAQGRPAGELMHGFLALVEEGTPIIAVIANDSHQAKMIASMKKARSRGAHLFVVNCGQVELPPGLAKEVISLPKVPDELVPLIVAVPLQLLAHDVGVVLKLPVDKPRNLAKSVTVE